MEKYLCFIVNEYAYEKNKSEILKLNEALAELGMELRLDNGDEQPTLTICYDLEKIHHKSSRGAGRKRAFVRMCLTPAEVREKLKTQSAEALAKELGISRSTLFRKLKEAEENGYTYLE